LASGQFFNIEVIGGRGGICKIGMSWLPQFFHAVKGAIMEILNKFKLKAIFKIFANHIQIFEVFVHNGTLSSLGTARGT